MKRRWNVPRLLQLLAVYVVLSTVVFYVFHHRGRLWTLQENNSWLNGHRRQTDDRPLLARTDSFYRNELTFPCHGNIIQVPLPPLPSDDSVRQDVYANYSEALAANADENKVIILLVVDSGYIDMAINLHRTSLLRLGINNFLFICVDEQSGAILHSEGVRCFHYDMQSALNGTLVDITLTAQGKTRYGMHEFRMKTHRKTLVVLEALLLGYSVVLSDVDIVYFKNPLPVLQADYNNGDIKMQRDGRYKGKLEFNSGFYLVNPTEAGIALHQRALALAMTNEKLSNQKAIGQVLQEMLKDNSIVLVDFNHVQFPNGIFYFEMQGRLFPNRDRRGSVIVHNNWISGKKAKVHRFKAHVLWFVDTEKYFTNAENKYLVYGNPATFGRKTIPIEIQALKNALLLGHILNRIVILPKFGCNGCTRYRVCFGRRCPVYVHYSIAQLENFFSGAYREHSFFCHPWVPLKLKTATPNLDVIASDYVNVSNSNVNVFEPANRADGPSKQEILEWFDNTDSRSRPILLLHNLYGTFASLFNDPDYTYLVGKLKAAFVKSDYRQHL